MMWVLHSQGTFHADPVALGRPRMSRFGAYTPKKSREYQQSMLDAIQTAEEQVTSCLSPSATRDHRD
jgi:hypothetical protein